MQPQLLLLQDTTEKEISFIQVLQHMPKCMIRYWPCNNVRRSFLSTAATTEHSCTHHFHIGRTQARTVHLNPYSFCHPALSGYWLTGSQFPAAGQPQPRDGKSRYPTPSLCRTKQRLHQQILCRTWHNSIASSANVLIALIINCAFSSISFEEALPSHRDSLSP